MSRRALQWLLVGTVLPACVAEFEISSTAVVACMRDADCPATWRCGVRAVCLPPGANEDLEAPELVGIAAVDAQSIVVNFGEPMDLASLAVASHYEIGPPLEVLGAVGDVQRVTLVTASQEVGQLYTLTIRDVADASGNVVAAPGLQGTFIGEGIPTGTSAPDLFSPEANGRVVNLTPTLVWTGRIGASSYTVEVEDADNDVPIPGSPFLVQAPSTTLAVSLPEARSYVWRVSSDVMVDTANQATFHALDSNVYVYCPSGAACTPDVGVGNKAHPHMTISQAIVTAQELGLHRVNIAGRGDWSQRYDEHVDLRPSVSLYGGYTSDFEEANRWDFAASLAPDEAHSTTIRRDETYTVTAVLIQEADPPTVVDDYKDAWKIAQDQKWTTTENEIDKKSGKLLRKTVTTCVKKMDLWEGCRIPLDTYVSKTTRWSNSKQVYETYNWVLAATKSYSSSEVAITRYGLRTQVEERFRQLKCFWNIADFPSPAPGLMEAQLCFISLTYSLLQLYLRRSDLRKLTGKTIASLHEEERLGKDAVLVYADESYGAYDLDDYTVTIMDLKAGPKEKLKGIIEKQKEVKLTREDPRQRIR